MAWMITQCLCHRQLMAQMNLPVLVAQNREAAWEAEKNVWFITQNLMNIEDDNWGVPYGSLRKHQMIAKCNTGPVGHPTRQPSDPARPITVF